MDEDEKVPYRIGDFFYSLTAEEASERMEEQIETIKEQLEQLKVQLYGKFGNSINLEK